MFFKKAAAFLEAPTDADLAVIAAEYPTILAV